jgi:hypothetical protein
MFVFIASENLTELFALNASKSLNKRQGNLFFYVCHMIKILLNGLTYNARAQQWRLAASFLAREKC